MFAAVLIGGANVTQGRSNQPIKVAWSDARASSRAAGLRIQKDVWKSIMNQAEQKLKEAFLQIVNHNRRGVVSKSAVLKWFRWILMQAFPPHPPTVVFLYTFLTLLYESSLTANTSRLCLFSLQGWLDRDMRRLSDYRQNSHKPTGPSFNGHWWHYTIEEGKRGIKSAQVKQVC